MAVRYFIGEINGIAPDRPIGRWCSLGSRIASAVDVQGMTNVIRWHDDSRIAERWSPEMKYARMMQAGTLKTLEALVAEALLGPPDTAPSETPPPAYPDLSYRHSDGDVA